MATLANAHIFSILSIAILLHVYIFFSNLSYNTVTVEPHYNEVSLKICSL